MSELVRLLKGRSIKLLMEDFSELRRRYWRDHFKSISCVS
ncbi:MULTISPECIES: hypothetical protein [unclassified Spirosoma]|nr:MULTISPECIES: hypothetical protein [unclassified Spirosoma]